MAKSRALSSIAQSNAVIQHGFTLLEVLIAMAIFAIISLTSFTIFDTIFASDEQSKVKNARLNELNRAFILIERDMLQVARRTVRMHGEAPTPGYLHMDDQGFFSETNALAFVRGGWSNPGLLLPRSDMQAVAYHLEENTLMRLHYNFVDPVVGEEPKSRPLISNVEDVKFEFYQDDKWLRELKGEQLPLAIALIIQTTDFGEIRRQFLVAGDVSARNDDEN